MAASKPDNLGMPDSLKEFNVGLNTRGEQSLMMNPQRKGAKGIIIERVHQPEANCTEGHEYDEWYPHPARHGQGPSKNHVISQKEYDWIDSSE